MHGSCAPTRWWCGVAILVKENVFEEINCLYGDDDGRLLVVEGVKAGKNYRFINIHAPNKVIDRKVLFGEAERWCNDRAIMMGDFNVVLSRMDVSNVNKFLPDSSRDFLFKIMKEKNLVEIWRVLNPTVKVFSRVQVVQGKLKRSRIDFCFLTKNFVGERIYVDYKDCCWSDHSGMVLSLGGPCFQKRNGGTWCFNNSLLQQQAYVNMVHGLLLNVKYELFLTDDIIEWWEGFKVRIKKT
uniref:Endonuclease/exonuclease/phosphatase domain-containing protein n=1 Tax=Gouania willdenowi TaxID=441366 RepID=A0A8C5GE13_GOUWI